MTLAERCEAEVVDFHRFFEEWFAGRTDDPGRLAAVLADGFHIVTPGGEVRSRIELVGEIEDAHGIYEDVDFSIRIGAFEPRHVTEGACLATYEEWRTIDDRDEGRVSTALLRRGEAPHGVEWVHVHETGMTA